MELQKNEEPPQHAVNLLGAGGDNQSKPADSAQKSLANKRNILIVVFLLLTLSTILAIAFALKSSACCKSHNSCKNRCSDAPSGSGSCRCDQQCQQEGNCCLDYKEVCVEPLISWTCNKFRCGEKPLAQSLCSCSPDCVKHGNCCANYISICSGKTSWQEEECQEIQEPQCPAGFSRSPLILVSLDGFRASYMKSYEPLMPVLSKLKRCGTSTSHMRPVYPTKTFPNHYTIVTGLYPESHGIVDNKMYDVTRNAEFLLKSKEKFNPLWYLGEPVWLSAMKNDIKAGTFFWPGGDVAIQGKFPTFHQVYDGKVPYEKRVATILDWLRLPEGERPDFYTLYLEEPDHSGHRHGPQSSQVIEALIKMDRIIGLLMEGLKMRNLHKCVNVIVLSDHGMEQGRCDRAVHLNSYPVNTSDFTLIMGPAARIRPKRIPEEFFSFDYEGVLANLSCRTPDQPMRPYLKENLPKRFHFANNVRIEQAHLYMKETYWAAVDPSDTKYCSGGFHGSDNLFQSMQAIFIAHGPGLKYNTTVAPFENIEVYNLMCDLLGIRPAPNNGTHGSLNHLLKRPRLVPAYPAEMSLASACSATASIPTDDLGCTCGTLTEAKVEDLNAKLMQSDPRVKPVHLPYGIPRVLQENADHCVLLHSDYITGFSKDIRMPLWVAYTLNAWDTFGDTSQDCVRADVRVSPSMSQNCGYYRNNDTVTFGLLHPPNLSSKDKEWDSLLTSNMAPMFPTFLDVWEQFHKTVVMKYSKRMNGVNIISGPIFDVNYDGHYDDQTKQTLNAAPLPTHFFVILTGCKNDSFSPYECEGPLDAVAFILPHRPDRQEMCSSENDFQWVEEWAKLHVARVRDVELLTGLSFYHDQLEIDKTLQIKTSIKTF
ncbi:ectonucleotide pyrophosphatase/phosphodiesterase family member 1 [Alosa sapidissima]|uniref:ectonucleotide pyrophosphatase/phosphodiesterase family member 1 n=1 Tax=Alosa sapidissima TaxID=34773 RepID=UPI001C09C65F|nr:ectonucleotide pyrophosphatase/phosphodiesterase family member 1 [Alosa sapidissima]